MSFWSFMKVVIASIFIVVSASKRKCQKLHLLLVRSGSTAASFRKITSLPGLRSLCLLIASISASATDEPLPWMM